MKRLDLIIDALENSEPTGTGWVHVHEQKHQAALAAAHELRALKPVAWAAPSIYGGFEGLSFDKQPRFETPLYALGDDK
jgi:hypothetical protein